MRVPEDALLGKEGFAGTGAIPVRTLAVLYSSYVHLVTLEGSGYRPEGAITPEGGGPIDGSLQQELDDRKTAIRKLGDGVKDGRLSSDTGTVDSRARVDVCSAIEQQL